MLGYLEDCVHYSGHVIEKGLVEGCGEKLTMWIRLPPAWGVLLEMEHRSTLNHCIMQVWHRV